MQAIQHREVITIDDSDSELEDGLHMDNAQLLDQFYHFDQNAQQQLYDGIIGQLPDPVDPMNLEVLPEQPTAPVVETDPAALYQAYVSKVLEVFPDICLKHVQQLYDAHTQADGEQRLAAQEDDISQRVITQILDGGKYPKERDTRRALKRKRESEEEEGEDVKWTSHHRPDPDSNYREEARAVLAREFLDIPTSYINATLREKKFLYATYLELELVDRTYRDQKKPPYQKLKVMRDKRRARADRVADAARFDAVEMRSELDAVRRRREMQDAQRRKKQEEADADLALEQEAQERGDMVECQCCFTDVPTAKSTHCSGDLPHFFCLECARGHAKSQAELSRHQVMCMDGSGCKAEFSRAEKIRFLDVQMFELFERLEQQAALRNANVEGLEKCPFCDFAAIYPPVEVNKEFRCEVPDCGRISCRLCKLDSHLPLTCEQYKKEQGVDERRHIEEAMTKAILRDCPKCKAPIVKDGGCNKLVCPVCRCFVCDYCGKDISKEGYTHFEQVPGTGGCPPTDDTDTRNANRIKEAEQQTMARIRAENPGLTEEDLKIKFSKEVLAKERTTVAGANGIRAGVGLGPVLQNLQFPMPQDVNAAGIHAQMNAMRLARAQLPQHHLGVPPQILNLAAPLLRGRPGANIDNERRAEFDADVQRRANERRRVHDEQQEIRRQEELRAEGFRLREQERQREQQRQAREAAMNRHVFPHPTDFHLFHHQAPPVMQPPHFDFQHPPMPPFGAVPRHDPRRPAHHFVDDLLDAPPSRGRNLMDDDEMDDWGFGGGRLRAPTAQGNRRDQRERELAFDRPRPPWR